MKKVEQTEMDKLVEEMMEHICDNLCKHPIQHGITQEQLEDICAGCAMGKFVCEILNTHNRAIENRRWIPVTGHLPKDGEDVEVTVDGREG